MRELILHNFWLKVFSLVLASVIWFVLQANLDTEKIKYTDELFRPSKTREFNCPVKLLVNSSDFQRYQIEPTDVLIRVQGDSSTVNALEVRDIQAYVSLAASGDPIGYHAVGAIVPKGVTLLSIFPAHVRVTPSG